MQALILLVPLFLLWFLIVRPQQRRIRDQRAMVLALEVGDDVITSAGIYGTIVDLDGDVAVLEVADGVRLRIARLAIGNRLSTHVDRVTEPEPDTELAGEGPRPQPGPDAADPSRVALPEARDEDEPR